MSKYLVTGGAGFIGSHLVDRLLDIGHEVHILDNLFRGKLENLDSALKRGAHFVKLDLVKDIEAGEVLEFLKSVKPAYIIHYAAINGTEHFYESSLAVAEVNSIGTYNLLSAVREICRIDKSYKPKIIFASSSEVYCEPFELPTPENALTYARLEHSRDSYSMAKMMSEFFVKLFSEELNLEYLIFRIFNTYGDRMVGNKYGQVIPEFLSRLRSGEYPLKIIGDGQQSRSFMHVYDHVELVMRCIASGNKNKVINLGNPSEIKIADLAVLIMKKMNVGGTDFIPSSPRGGDHARRLPDITTLRNIIGGDYRFKTLSEGIDSLIESN